MIDVGAFLQGLGPWALVAIAVIVFIESGLLVPFLPGDSLLVSAGLLHEQLGLSVAAIAGVAVAAAVVGDQVGYLIGSRFGTRLFRADAKVLTTTRLHETQAFFDRYGGRALLLARFVPVVRTFAPLIAGSVRFPHRTFLPWNISGGVTWAVGVTVLGSLLGGVQFITDNIDVLLTVLVVISVLPLLLRALHRRRGRPRTPHHEY